MNLKTQQISIILLLINCLSICLAMPDFGMNKPHYLFHLGDRQPVSMNIGWGYWSGLNPLRLNYKNTNDQLYAAMEVHDGQSMFKQNIRDDRYGINSSISYQLKKNHWETEIKMENFGNESATWFTYFAVENNDYRLIDHEKYSTYMSLKPEIIDKSQVQFACTSSFLRSKMYRVKETQQSKISLFGMTMNISETYTISNIANQFKHLVEVHRGENVKRIEDKKVLSWENKQLEMMSSNAWEEQSYVLVFAYGTIRSGKTAKIFITNSTTAKEFDEKNFNENARKLAKKYEHENPKMEQFIQHVVSNLYAGTTFYYGRLYTQNSLIMHKQDYSYTFTPSRLIFPRSFLWDDGFHQSVIVHYNEDMVLDMLKNWMNKVDIFGWIGREQIRGAEISMMMPDERFVFQDWFEMNPPTLFLPIITLIQKSEENQQLGGKVIGFLRKNFNKLQMWYRYFKSTQSHENLDYRNILNESSKFQRFYRWQCKDQCSRGNFMGSGLDDYPRQNNSTEVSKQHVDLLSWLYFFSRGLTQIGQLLSKTSNESRVETQKYEKATKYFETEAKRYKAYLYERLHDKTDQLFKDVVVIRNDLFLEKFVDKIGYINLFPFITGMLKEEGNDYQEERVKSLKKSIEIMEDESLLMSEDGLRSLSISDSQYATEENYWRGPVWMPINYMVLRACKMYYWNDSVLGEEVKRLYKELRNRLIRTVYKNYRDTGYLYENYYKGQGHRGFPFYGWTSVISNIVSQKY